jgi:hypothetical protein
VFGVVTMDNLAESKTNIKNQHYAHYSTGTASICSGLFPVVPIENASSQASSATISLSTQRLLNRSSGLAPEIEIMYCIQPDFLPLTASGSTTFSCESQLYHDDPPWYLSSFDRGSLYRYKMLSLNNIGDSFLLTTLIEAFTGAACDIVGVIIVRVARHLFDLRHWMILAS